MEEGKGAEVKEDRTFVVRGGGTGRGVGGKRGWRVGSRREWPGRRV